MRWKPKGGEIFYKVAAYGDSVDSVNTDDYLICRYVGFGNCFRTKEQAEEAAKRIRETLEKYHEEIGE